MCLSFFVVLSLNKQHVDELKIKYLPISDKKDPLILYPLFSAFQILSARRKRKREREGDSDSDIERQFTKCSVSA